MTTPTRGAGNLRRVSPSFQAPVGTRDVLPPQSARWEALVALFAEEARRAGYGLVVGPTFEDVGVFERVGESTDVVRKEMYDFRDKGGRHLALRPEGTAAIVRAYVQHRPTPPWKAWYVGPHFRYERPQAGRYRQHHQLGVEVLGTDDPDADVEVVALAWAIYRALGLSRVRLKVNSMGDAESRPAYAAVLAEYLGRRRDDLTGEARETLAANPLRLFDSKRPPDVAVMRDAPRLVDHLSPAAAAHFARVREGLDALGIPHEVDPALVRGFDYYTRTTFEFAAEALESAQDAVGGGGRYDGLAEALGGPRTAGIGFGMGIERLLLACDAEGVFGVPEGRLDVFVVDTTGGAAARDLTAELRRAGISADRAFDDRSWKAQFAAAKRSGARFAAVVGDRERAEGTVTVREVAAREAEVVAAGDLVDHLRKRLGEGGPES